MTLGDRLLGQPNGLTTVRLMLALWVIAVHAWTIGGFDPDSPYFLAAPFGQWAIPGFFALSGFLIARSRLHLSLVRFLYHRALRIFPAYWVCILVVAFVLAPLSTMRGGDWALSDGADFVVSNALVLRQLAIPGTVSDHVWNASLWTLTYELLAYLLAGLLLTGASRRQGASLAALLLIALTAGNAWVFGHGPPAPTPHVVVPYVVALQLGSYFAAGMLFFFLANRVRCSTRWAMAALALLVAAQLMNVEEVVGAIPAAYLVLWAGATLPARWSPKSDLSYGVYIYAFPMQVLLEWHLPDLSLLQHIIGAVLLTWPLAWLSWHWVEAPASRVKHIGLAPGVAVPQMTVGPASHDELTNSTSPPLERT